MDRILRDTPATFQITLYDASGNPANAGGAVTAAIADSSGAGIVGSPFGTSNPSTGVYQVAPAATSLNVLDRYRITWNLPDGTVRYTDFEIAGAFYFAVAELRAFDSVFTDQTAYPEATIVARRNQVEEKFEVVCPHAFVPRGKRVTLDGTATAMIFVPDIELRSVISASVNGVALSSTDLSNLAAYAHGQVVRLTGFWPAGNRNVQILYEYGMDEAPSPIKDAALRYCRHLLLKTALEANERATAVFTDIGGYRLSMAGKDGPTGLPEVDAVLKDYGAGLRRWNVGLWQTG